MKALGFADVFEVAIGADLCAVQEAEDFVKEVPEQLPFMATSCCPAWSMMAKKLFPDYANCISMALTPMTLTARLIKKQHEKAGQILLENRAKLDELSQYLYEKETITGEEFMKILNS